jgi:hypothetical protein
MKVQIKPIHASPIESPAVTYEGLLEVTLSKIFNGVKIRTEDGTEFGIALRDSGLEITCPDGTMVGVKLHGPARSSYATQAFIERNGKVIG